MTKVRRAEWLTNPAGGHVTEQRLASVVLLQTAARACLARLRFARDYARVLRGIVLLQAVVRGWIERVGWRDATFGEEGDYPPMTITTHLYIVRSPMYIQDTIDVMLDELFDTAVAGEVAAAAATRIQAAVRGRAICVSLNRLHALYPNAGALNLIARRISGGARALNKNIFVFCSRTTRLPPLPKEVLVALISTRLSHCAHADQAPRDQPVASGRALGNAAPQQTDSQPVPQGTPQGEGSSARAEKAGTEGTGQLKRREAEKQAARRRAAEKQAARRRAAAARAAAAKVAAATAAAEAELQGQCQVVEWGGLLFWCDSAAGKAAEKRYWKAEGLWSSDEEEVEEDDDHRRNQLARLYTEGLGGVIPFCGARSSAGLRRSLSSERVVVRRRRRRRRRLGWRQRRRRR